MNVLATDDLARLQQRARQVRRHIVNMVFSAQSGHLGGSLGATELLVALYFYLMKHDPADLKSPTRDRFIMSKGHCTPVYYACLAEAGYFPTQDLATFRRPGSHLQGHPHQLKTPGVEASTGTLGLGISTAVGMALAAKLRQQNHHYFVLCGDGEIQEGQVWEAAMFGNKYHLDNVIAFVDRNYLQTDGHSESVMPLDPLKPKWESFGWRVEEIDGHDFSAIIHAVNAAKASSGKPTMIIANTVKGKGVSFMENQAQWHGQVPNEDEWKAALEQL
jgi:transketolase